MILNLSALFMLLVLSTAPHICVIGLIVSLVLGYRINMERDSQDFKDCGFDDIVKNARENVQQAVSGVAKQFSQTEQKEEEPAASHTARNESAPSGKRPVNVQFSDEGSVNVRDDGDGYHEADIR